MALVAALVVTVLGCSAVAERAEPDLPGRGDGRAPRSAALHAPTSATTAPTAPTTTTGTTALATTAAPTSEATTTVLATAPTEAPPPEPPPTEPPPPSTAPGLPPPPVTQPPPVRRAASPGSATAGTFFTLTNATRSGIGIGRLSYDADLEAYATAHAQVMAGAGTIFHSHIADLLGAWSTVGENVGVGPDAQLINDALNNSPPHYENISYTGYTHMGVGVVIGADGRIYTTHVFAA